MKEKDLNHHSVGDFFSSLFTLTRMQAKEKIDFSYLRSFKATLFKMIYSVIGFVLITLICYFIMFFAQLLTVFDRGDVPISVLAIVFSFMLLLSTVFTTAALVKSLYLSKDNQVLLTFPATSSTVFLSKLLVYYVYELKKNLMFLVPLFLAYGIFKGFSPLYYIRAILLIVGVSLIPILIAALLSMPALYIYQFLRRHAFLQALIFIGMGAGILYLILSFASGITAAYDDRTFNMIREWPNIKTAINNVLDGFSTTMLPLMWLTEMIVGPAADLGNMLNPYCFYSVGVMLAVIIVLLVLGFVLSRPLFYSMASKPFEHTKRNHIRPKKNKKVPIFFSAIKKEWLIATRDGSLVALLIQLVVIMPLSVYLLNVFYKILPTGQLGDELTIGFTFLITLLCMLSASIRLASAYSKDGAAAYLNKVQPSTYGQLLFAKLIPNLLFGLVGIVLTAFVYFPFGKLNETQTFYFVLTAYLLYLAHLFWSAEMDIVNPQHRQYATFSDQANNPNENISSLLVFAIAFIVTLVLVLLCMEDPTQCWYKVIGIAAVLAVFKAATFFTKIKVFYKES